MYVMGFMLQLLKLHNYKLCRKLPKKVMVRFLLGLALLGNFSFSTQAANAELRELVTSLKRVLTAGMHGHHPLKTDYKPAFFYRPWLERWDTTALDGQHKFNSYPSADFEKFHGLLSKRLSEHSGSFVSSNIQVGFHPRGKRLIAKDMDDVDDKLALRINHGKPFIDGHIVQLRGTTAFPINLFTLAQENSQYINFGTPLQHGFYLNNLGNYYDSIALLRDWAAYRDVRIISIPAGVKINCRVGLIAPQEFPGEKIQYTSNPSGRITAGIVRSVRTAYLEDLMQDLGLPIDHLLENRPGGDIQIMFGYVEDYTVYNYGAICTDSNGDPKKYVIKSNNKWNNVNQGQLNHFLDPDYFLTPFRAEDFLLKLRVIGDSEKEEIVKFLHEKKIR